MSPSPAYLDADTPNPFAMGVAAANPTVLQRFRRGTKTVLLTLLVTTVLLSTVYFGKHLLLSQLVSGFKNLDSGAKQTRLIQIASFGNAAIEPLVERLIDSDDSVSESAFVLLQKMQNDWITLDGSNSMKPHQRLVESIQLTYRNQLQTPLDNRRLTDKQIARGRELLNQTVLALVESGSGEAVAMTPEVSTLVGAANQLLEQLRKSYATQRPATLVKNKETALQNRAGWTDWPPKSQQQLDSPSSQLVDTNPRSAGTPVETSHRLQTLPSGVTVPLSQIVSSPRRPKVLAAKLVASPHPSRNLAQVDGRDSRAESVLQMTNHLTESPLAALDDETVIRHLANPDAMIVRQAQSELNDRGFTFTQIEMAKSIAMAGPDDRIRLIDSLVHSSEFNSTPWLSMLIDDPDRKVRMHVVSTLSAGLVNFRDPALLTLLRDRLNREKDWHVAWRIRKTLEQR